MGLDRCLGQEEPRGDLGVRAAACHQAKNLSLAVSERCQALFVRCDQLFIRCRVRDVLADRVEQTLRKGQQIFIEGHLKLDQWTSQDGQKKSRLYVRADNFQFLQPREGGPGEVGSRFQSAAPASRMQASAVPSGSEFEEPPAEPYAPVERGDETIPF